MPSHLSFLFQNFGPVITSLLKLPQFHEEDLCKVHTLFNFYHLKLQKRAFICFPIFLLHLEMY